MRSKRTLLLAAALALVILVAATTLTPLAVALGVRTWLWAQARRQHLKIELTLIDAPLGRPVVIHNLHVASAPGAPFRIALRVPRLEADLRIAAFLGANSGRTLRHAKIERPELEISHDDSAKNDEATMAWATLHRLLSDSLEIVNASARIQTAGSVLQLDEVTLDASELAPGQFRARKVAINSPLLRTTFAQLRGATRWQEDRFTLAAITLTSGLDLQSLTLDLSRLAAHQISADLDFDAFGGTFRVAVTSEESGRHRSWNVAGGANNISLPQVSEAIGLTEKAAGSLHAAKFTFRGDPANPADANASIWLELSDLQWRRREAEILMLGASLNDSQIDVQQLYLKQRENEITLDGQMPLPTALTGLLDQEFHGEIAASLHDLAEFAHLFGARGSGIGGAIEINGTIDGRARDLDGQLVATGHDLQLAGAPVGRLDAVLLLRGSELQIARLELRRGDDFLRGSGRIGLAKQHPYSGNLSLAVANVADYRALLPPIAQGASGAVNGTWTGDGSTAAHYGNVHAIGHALTWPTNFAAPQCEVAIEGAYSPDSLFLRDFRLWNENAALTAFVTVAPQYLQAQTVRFDLRGTPKLEGNVFVPVAWEKWIGRDSFLAATDRDAHWDVDLHLAPVDLSELGLALHAAVPLHGNAEGQLAVYGTLAAREGAAEIHLRNAAAGSENPLTSDLEIVFAEETATIKQASITLPHSSGPRSFTGSVQFADERVRAKISFPPNVIATAEGDCFSAIQVFDASRAPLKISRAIVGSNFTLEIGAQTYSLCPDDETKRVLAIRDAKP